MRRAYLKCFEFFSHKQAARESFFLANYLDLVDAYSRFLQRNGYAEKALGLYQALVDFSFCVNTQDPASEYANLDVKSRRALYELFFDMGLPKLGETHYTGWLNSLANRDSQFDKLESEQHQGEARYDDQLDVLEDSILAKENERVEFKWKEIERLR